MNHPYVSYGVSLLSESEVRENVKLTLVVRTVMSSAKTDDALRVVASPSSAGDYVRGIYGSS